VAERITEELEAEKPDSRRLRDLSDAQAKLAEQERILAGRPLPGSRRPGTTKDPGPQVGAWLTPEPTGPAPEVPACGVDTPTGGVLINNPNIQTPQDSK
jgi:hypothetical protein